MPLCCCDCFLYYFSSTKLSELVPNEEKTNSARELLRMDQHDNIPFSHDFVRGFNAMEDTVDVLLKHNKDQAEEARVERDHT